MAILLSVAAVSVGTWLTSVSRSVQPFSLDWESGDNSAFSNLECAHPAEQFGVVTTPVREGQYAGRFSESGQDVWSNGAVRCLDAAYGTGETTGDDLFFGFSIYIPSPGLSDNLIWELHQPQSLYAVRGCAIAPIALAVRHGVLQVRLASGNCGDGRGSAHWEPNIRIPKINPYPRDRWIDFVIHVKFEEKATGMLALWARPAGARWTPSPLVARRHVPTMPYCASCHVHDVRLYTELGLYPGSNSYDGHDTIYIDGYRRGGSFSEVAPG